MTKTQANDLESPVTPPQKMPAAAVALVLIPLLACGCMQQHKVVGNSGPLFVTLSDPGFIQQWQFQIQRSGDESVRGLYLLGDTLHVMTDQNIDHALTASGGDLLYFNRIADPDTGIRGGPVNLDDYVVFATSHTLEVYDKHGRFQRSIFQEEGVTGPPTGAGNFIYLGIGELNGRLRCVDVTRDVNPTVWQVLTGGRVDGAPAVYEKEIYCGSEDGSVVGVDEDGNTLWPLLDDYKFKTGGQIVADMKADRSGVYAVSGDQSLYCIDRGSGHVRWRYFAGTPLETSPTVTSTSVYLYIPGRGLAAIPKSQPITLDSQQTKYLGEEPIHNEKWIAPDAVAYVAEDDQYVYVQSTSNSLLALDKQTGQVVFSSRRHDLAFFATNLKDSTIYAATTTGEILAIKADTTPGTIGELVSAQDGAR
jgi:putative pyrroloquinoline-quinone binding quinoprotein